jgi:hypothetical protein
MVERQAEVGKHKGFREGAGDRGNGRELRE